METPQQPKLLDCVRQTARFRPLSRKTKKSYLQMALLYLMGGGKST
jgi:hypothetical protein